MFRMAKNDIITDELLQHFLREHKRQIDSRYQKLHDAYTSQHDILKAPKKPKYKPDNRIVVNFPKYITDTMNGFFIGNPVKTMAEDKAVAEYVEHIEQYNDQDDNNAELSKIMSIYGKGFEMYYADEEAELCITYFSPLEAFMIYDDSIRERRKYFVRRYTDEMTGTEYGSISDSENVRYFEYAGGIKWLGEWEPHYFAAGVPAIEYIENAERQGIFEPILSIVNAYNKAISEKANDVDYFADAYLKVLGVKVEGEDVEFIRDNRIVNFFGDDAEKIIAEFMGKPESDTAQENLLNRLERLAFQIAMVANISDENFGAASGISLKYKLLAMSNLAKTKQRKFTSGMNQRYKLLFSHPAAKVPEDAYLQLNYQFTFNYPANLAEEAQIAAQLEGIVSKETQLKILSAVDNVEEEIEKLEEESETAAQKAVESFMFGNVPAAEENTETEKDIE